MLIEAGEIMAVVLTEPGVVVCLSRRGEKGSMLTLGLEELVDLKAVLREAEEEVMASMRRAGYEENR